MARGYGNKGRSVKSHWFIFFKRPVSPTGRLSFRAVCATVGLAKIVYEQAYSMELMSLMFQGLPFKVVRMMWPKDEADPSRFERLIVECTIPYIDNKSLVWQRPLMRMEVERQLQNYDHWIRHNERYIWLEGVSQCIFDLAVPHFEISALLYQRHGKTYEALAAHNDRLEQVKRMAVAVPERFYP